MNQMDIMRRNIAYGFSIAFFVIFLFVIWHGVDEGIRDVAMVLLAVLTAAIKEIISYCFGGSAGSDRKSELLAKNGNGNGASNQ